MPALSIVGLLVIGLLFASPLLLYHFVNREEASAERTSWNGAERHARNDTRVGDGSPEARDDETDADTDGNHWS